jgi:hypothetical protein
MFMTVSISYGLVTYQFIAIGCRLMCHVKAQDYTDASMNFAHLLMTSSQLTRVIAESNMIHHSLL